MGEAGREKETLQEELSTLRGEMEKAGADAVTKFKASQSFVDSYVKYYGTCKVEFNQPSCWLYSVPNFLVFQQLVTLYLGGIFVRVVSEIV